MQVPDNSAIPIAMTIGGTIILGLIAAVWKLVRDEAAINAAALDKKASSEALREAKADFNTRLEQQKIDHQHRLHEVSLRQDREIDWLKDEMSKISDSIAEMRRENISANNTILDRLQNLAMAVGARA